MTRRTLFLLAAGSAAAQTGRETAQQRGKRVVDRALEEAGGQRFLAMEDRIEEGRAYSFYREELKGLSLAKVYTRYLTRPEPPVAGFLGVRGREVYGKRDDNYLLFTEIGAWQVNFRGARPLPDERVRLYRESTLCNVFYILRQRLGEPGLTFFSKGSEIYENQPVEIVEIGDATNRLVTVYFSQSTGLPVRQMFQRRNAITRDRDDEVTRFSKYRDVGDGVMWPFQILRERNGEKIFELYSESVKINRNLTDDLFTLPGNVKLLKKEK
jgi:hypothetical protein